MDIMKELRKKAEKAKRTIVFPEGENPVILRAAAKLKKEGLAEPLLVGSSERIHAAIREQNLAVTDRDPVNAAQNEDFCGFCIADPHQDKNLSRYILNYCQERQMPEEAGKRIIMQPLCYSAMLVKAGRAGGMVAGIDHPTEEVIMASELILGLKSGISVPSSFYLAEIPGYQGSQNELMIFSDPSMNPDPTAEELADIAYATAMSARSILDWEPRVALLSFSTKGSAEHARVAKVQAACEALKHRNCDFLFDGELQADAAINAEIGTKKTGGKSRVAGRANILIFPDLDACNIASKLVQQFTGARLYGPVLQGFSFPVSDLSRGASVEDVVGSALLIAAD